MTVIIDTLIVVISIWDLPVSAARNVVMNFFCIFLQAPAFLPLLSSEKGCRIWRMATFECFKRCSSPSLGIQYSQTITDLFPL